MVMWRRCPECHSEQVRLSTHVSTAEKFLMLVLLRPYRCESCDLRYYGFLFSRRKDEQSPPQE